MVSKEECLKIKAELQDKTNKTYCPICKDMCVSNCVAYKPFTMDRIDLSWEYSGGYCTAYMLVGPE